MGYIDSTKGAVWVRLREGGGLFALDVDEAFFEDEGDGGIV